MPETLTSCSLDRGDKVKHDPLPEISTAQTIHNVAEQWGFVRTLTLYVTTKCCGT